VAAHRHAPTAASTAAAGAGGVGPHAADHGTAHHPTPRGPLACLALGLAAGLLCMELL
jgi:hypothetical protein